MSKLLIILSLFQISSALSATRLPKEITDDFLQVKAVELTMQTYPKSPYTITLISSNREADISGEWASGFMYLFFPNGSCAFVGNIVESGSCLNVQNCHIEGGVMHLPNCDLRKTLTAKDIYSLAKSGRMNFKLSSFCNSQNKTCSTRWVNK